MLLAYIRLQPLSHTATGATKATACGVLLARWGLRWEEALAIGLVRVRVSVRLTPTLTLTLTLTLTHRARLARGLLTTYN